MNGGAPVVAFDAVSKRYVEGTVERWALRDVSFDLHAGRSVAVVGRSGSGKTTLLHLAAGIDVPTAGRVELDGRALESMSDAARSRMRRERVGLVFQFFHLLPHLSVEDNVALPEMIAGTSADEFRARARELLRRVGLADRASSAVHRLSGGERQRVAICRALIRRPSLLLADEPTGNLDDATGDRVMELLDGMAEEVGATLLYVTHSRRHAAYADETWTLNDGRLEGGG
ncbi:MAG: ABC transporter ATP-binding protein [Gemmatimonadota bacterium]|nr:ABC transporter ATP-binding protein [Gemmatimonadota bacterium]